LFGRGACDDKGQLFAHLKALESYLMTDRALPVNVKCLFEGEEEMDSPHFAPFVAKHKRALGAHLAVMSDTRMLAPDRPAIGYAQRGNLVSNWKSKAHVRICIPEISAAPSTTLCRRCARCSPACTILTAA